LYNFITRFNKIKGKEMRKIPSAGPWITDKEVDYVTDACRNGWYENWSGYLDRFENAFASYIGVKHAIATSSCTGALHIAMKALDIGKGDEVIVPESTWVATAACVSYVGATPIFADIEPDTWCISPKDIKRKITKNTKAIIPVHMYGHPADMHAINKIASENGLVVIEDAAPGIGSKIGDKLVGSFGKAAAFSFQGAKPIVTGEGGMLTTDDDNFYDKAYYYWDHCRDANGTLFNTDVGVKYKMSNIQAALGLAQLERIDEIISKRRQIFFWYKEHLSKNTNISLNIEKEGYFNNFYVPTMILSECGNFNSRDIMDKLTGKGVLNRPFFHCISKMMPVYNESITPIADSITSRGINLPCATLLTEDDIKYACEHINEIVG
jgi:perosamine synthetase